MLLDPEYIKIAERDMGMDINRILQTFEHEQSENKCKLEKWRQFIQEANAELVLNKNLTPL